MREISMFVEDHAHHRFLEALIFRLAEEYGVPVTLKWLNVRRGHGAVLRELKQYFRDMHRGHHGLPDLVLIATDANCNRMAERLKQLHAITDQFSTLQIAYAIPDPHIERWFLLDAAAFKAVFGQGCPAPDEKCERKRYKRKLIEAIQAAGITPNLGGIEFADDIVRNIDLSRAARDDKSLKLLLDRLQNQFKLWAK